MTNYGYKPNEKIRYAIYSYILGYLKSYGYTKIGICRTQ